MITLLILLELVGFLELAGFPSPLLGWYIWVHGASCDCRMPPTACAVDCIDGQLCKQTVREM